MEKNARCGTPTSPGALFCEGCGASLGAATQAMQPSVPATQLKEVTYVPVVQVAKVVGAVEAVMYFIIGIFAALSVAASSSVIPGFPSAVMAILVFILMPIFGFIAGFVEAAVAALIYNWIVPRIGGIQVQVK